LNTDSIYIPMRVTAEPVADTEWERVLELINRHTIEPVVREDIFTFSGMASNDRMDAYLTRMDPATTLPNYVQDLRDGTPLMENHDVFSDPYGRSYDGELITPAESGAEITSVRGYWYLLRGLTINGTRSDDRIRAIKAGISKDMSVGFGGNDLYYRCSSCGRDLFDYQCNHVPGLEDENGRRTFAWVVNGHLREVSTVYRGATPGAYIDKAQERIQQGELSPENIYKLERTYQVRFKYDEKRSIFMPKKESDHVNLLEQIRAALKDNTVEKSRIYEVLSGEGEPFRQADDIAIRNELGDLATPEGVRQLKADADNGKKYVADLIDKAVAERVKVQGDSFDADKYKAMLVRVGDIDFIKDELASYEKQAKERFVSGRQTEPEDLEQELEPVTRSQNGPENIFD
jgi:hypothetical protein